MADPVTYTAVLPISRQTVERIAVLLHAHRRQLHTRSGRRSLGCFTQAVMFCRWMLQATRVRQLAIDHHVSLATAYRYLAEVLDVLAAQAPGLRGALLAAKIAGYRYVMLDGTLIPIDRCSAPGPTQGVDLWWSGKHHRHCGNIQVLTAPDGWPICVSPVRPGREYDVTCARTHPDLLDAVDAFSVDGRFVLADLGY